LFWMEPLPVIFWSFKTPLTLCAPFSCPPTLISDEPMIAVLWPLLTSLPLWLLTSLPLWLPLPLPPLPLPVWLPAKAAELNARADAAVIAIRVFLIDFLTFSQLQSLFQIYVLQGRF